MSRFFFTLFTLTLMAFGAHAGHEQPEQKSEMIQLELYVRTDCSYCTKVLRFMNAADITIPIHNVSYDPFALETLIDLTDKTQVPCLVIDGQPLLESDRIIEWLYHALLNEAA